MKNILYYIVPGLFALAAATCPAGEITTNGLGGGPWSDPATWRGKKIPGAADDVSIRKGDVVVFDRNDDGKVTCQKLLLDPRGGLKFKTGAGKVILCSAAGVESYGPISMDGTRSAADYLELRLVGEDRKQRYIKLFAGGALLAKGKAGLAGDARNVALVSPPLADDKEDLPLALGAGTGSTIDLQHVEAVNVHVNCDDIDNTGAKPNEKLNVVGTRFTRVGRINLQRCDTPLIAGNSFFHPDPKRREGRAMQISECPLAEIRDNTIRGGFDFAIAIGHGPDCVVAGNTVENCHNAIHIGYGSHAVTRNTIRGCDTAFDLHFAVNVTLEDNTVEGATTVISNKHSTAQFTTLRADKLAPDAVGVLFAPHGDKTFGSIVLLNCNLRPEQVKIPINPEKNDKAPGPPVTAMEFLVVAVKGARADAEVEVKSPGAGDSDLNVRNSPAPLASGSTPLPQPPGAPLTVSPLVVRSWEIGFDAKLVPAPEYTVRVLAPAEEADTPRKVLATATAKPDAKWFRMKVDAPAPTLEVTVK